MDSIMQISKSAMDVEYQRIEQVSMNLANANTTRTANGGPYVPKSVISGPTYRAFSSLVTNGALAPTGVSLHTVAPQKVNPRLAYEPSHPHADKNGMVSYPGINHSAEMLTLVQAQRVYEANVAVFNTARSMQIRALDLGAMK